jgi:hypothetical protein
MLALRVVSRRDILIEHVGERATSGRAARALIP